MPISGSIVQAQAEQFDKQLNGEDSNFKASTGWLDRFKKRHGISQVRVAGEIRSADTEAAHSYPDQLRQIIDDGGYLSEQSYNADETGLCYRMLPDKTLAIRTGAHKHKGFKKIKDRVTVLFCVNKTGSHKIKPLCIGKFQNPRFFSHINRKMLPLSYDFSRNAWMTSTIFENWFHKEFVPAVRKHLRQQRLEPKALLLLDNCPAHPPASSLVSRDGKIRVSYLPKNTTSKIQPLDQGVISTFKMIYRQELVKKIVDDEKPVQESLKAITLKEMINLAGQSWNAVSATSIEKCWMKGLATAFPAPLEAVDDVRNQDNNSDDNEEEFEGFTQADIDAIQRKIETSSDEVRQWLLADNECPVFEHASDAEIIKNVSGTSHGDTDADDAEDTDEIIEPPPKVAEAVEGLEPALKWLETQEVDYVKILHEEFVGLRKKQARGRDETTES